MTFREKEYISQMEPDSEILFLNTHQSRAIWRSSSAVCEDIQYICKFCMILEEKLHNPSFSVSYTCTAQPSLVLKKKTNTKNNPNGFYVQFIIVVRCLGLQVL